MSSLFFGECLENFVIFFALLLGVLNSVDLVSLADLLSTESLFGDHTLNFGCLVESLIVFLNFTVNNVLLDIVDLFDEVEVFSNVVCSFLSESVRVFFVGESIDLVVSLVDNAEGNDGKIGSSDATTDGFSLALTRSARSKGSSTYKKLY